MLNVAPYIESLQPYIPGKPIEETKRELGLKRVIKLASNENPLGPSPKAVVAIRKHLREMHRYPDASCFKLSRAVARHLSVKSEQLIFGNGSNEVMNLVARTFCVPGDEAVTSQGAFIAFKIGAQVHGIRVIETPLTSEFKFDLDAMLRETLKREKVRLVYIANPNNPTGTFVGRAELENFLGEIHRRRGTDVCVLLDCAYEEYRSDPNLPDGLSFLEKFANVIVARTFSKIHGLAALRLGYGVGQPDLITRVHKVRDTFNVNSLAQVAGEAALKDKRFVERAFEVNRKGMAAWEAALTQMGILFIRSQGNFILVDVARAMGCGGKELFEACLKRGVIFRAVDNYGMPHAIRISIGTLEENTVAIKTLRSEWMSRRKQ